MGAQSLNSLGDLTPVHDFVQHFSSKDFAYNNNAAEKEHKTDGGVNGLDTDTRPRSGVPLGDFSKLWEYLGTPSGTIEKASLRPELPLDAYASDGATFFRSLKPPKTVKWDEHETAEFPSINSLSDGSNSAPSNETKLTKTQRKRKNRQERRARATTLTGRSAALSESEADIPPAVSHSHRKGGSHYLYGKHDLISRYNKGKKGVETSLTDPEHDDDLPSPTPARRASAHALRASASSGKLKPKINDDNNFNAAIEVARNALLKEKSALAFNPSNVQRSPTQSTPAKLKPPFLPASVTPRPKTITPARHSMPDLGLGESHEALVKSTNSVTKPAIKPLVVRSLIDRYYGLIRRLDSDFPEDKQYLSAFSDTTMKFDPDGIHVFVDDSNIFIGFVDKLKENRQIPQKRFVEEPNLSFDAFALLLERRRPVAKRVLGGSKPELPAHTKARQIGYQCFLLDKVFKERELTERQIFFMERDRGLRSYNSRAPPANTVFSAAADNGNVFGTDTTPKRYGPARLVEQCVDELLHLKMADSMLDVTKPSTMVVATGDAASAEYSGGFMAQIERALVRGWSVELVSWQRNISSMYKRRDWTQKWAGRFRIIYLDDYVEELLDM